MNIFTWNIQAAKGCDGRFDISRIVKIIKSFGQMDVICLQEVAKHIPELQADDQPGYISSQFTGFEAVWAPGFSVPDISGRRSEFGNLTLVKQSLFRDARIHILPGPPVEELQMPRTMVEIVVDAGHNPIAVFNAHLAFHSDVERVQQMQALTGLRNQIIAKSNVTTNAVPFGPFNYIAACNGVILCGDLNISADSSEFKTHITDQDWVDCWVAQHGEKTADPSDRQPTCGCFDREQWPEGPHVRDYFLSTQQLAQKTTAVDVDINTAASDHQPLMLEIMV